MAATAAQEVIDWSEAMQQCGDDEEFLRELLADLRSEVEQQIGNINSIIQVRFFFFRISKLAGTVFRSIVYCICSHAVFLLLIIICFLYRTHKILRFIE
jgi:predicted PurR-regulated permease PerM